MWQMLGKDVCLYIGCAKERDEKYSIISKIGYHLYAQDGNVFFVFVFSYKK